MRSYRVPPKRTPCLFLLTSVRPLRELLTFQIRESAASQPWLRQEGILCSYHPRVPWVSPLLPAWYWWPNQTSQEQSLQDSNFPSNREGCFDSLSDELMAALRRELSWRKPIGLKQRPASHHTCMCSCSFPNSFYSYLLRWRSQPLFFSKQERRRGRI